MKKTSYIPMILMILLPYAAFISIPFSGGTAIIFQLIAELAVIVLACISAAKSPGAKAVKMNLIVKLCYIPIFVMWFVIGSMGIFASVWGIGIIAAAIIFNVINIIKTGSLAVPCITAARRDNIISRKEEILYIICSFIFCVDIAAAIVLSVTVNKRSKGNYLYAV